MNKPYVLISVLFLIMACNTGSNSKIQSEFDAAKEQAAIMAVIEKETATFYARDYEGWRTTRAQQDYDFQGWNNADGTFDVENGWQQVNAGIKNYIEKNKAPIGTKPEVIKKNIQCKFYTDSCAYLTWDEYTQDSTTNIFYKAKGLRLMEKQNSGWKIVSVAAFWDYKNKILKNSIQ